MQLAIWDTLPAELLASGITSGAVATPFEVVRMRPEECAARLISGDVDVALVPTMMALQGADGFDIVPGATLASWHYPYARLLLRGGLGGETATVAYDRRHVQERTVARLVLREHYGFEPEFIAYDNAPSTEELLEADEDAVLLAGPEALTARSDEGLVLDLGQEWYEMANYPMVWGLLAARKDTLAPEAAQALVAAVQAAEENRRLWMQAQEMPAGLHGFFQDSLRLRLDDLAVASLTEYKHQLFYAGVLSDIPDLSFARLPEKGASEEKSE